MKSDSLFLNALLPHVTCRSWLVTHMGYGCSSAAFGLWSYEFPAAWPVFRCEWSARRARAASLRFLRCKAYPEDMAISFARNTKPKINKFYSTIPDA
jgi:hypothetical protein